MSSKRKSTAKKEPDADARPSFESALQRLEEIIDKIEGEQLPLDDMVDHYEEGMKLLFSCRERIQQAKLRVETLEASFDSDRPQESTAPAPSAEVEPAAATGKQSGDGRSWPEDDDEIRLF
jgi:exodeoxyribonuclease VII small subunit